MVDKNGNKLLKPSPLKIIGAAIGAAVGIFGAIKGAKDKKAARKKMDAAQKALDKNKADYAAIDTSNPRSHLPAYTLCVGVLTTLLAPYSFSTRSVLYLIVIF